MTKTTTLRAVRALTIATALAATASAFAAPITSDQFAPGWQAHAQPLIHQGAGPGRTTPTTDWFVPSLLPRGHYVLVSRHGDKAEVIDGLRFEVTGDAARDVHVIVPLGYSNVEAVRAEDLPGA